jgi:hypothetical protein
MDLKTYFENTRGLGVLSTADRQGHVDAAVYSRPHVMEDGSLAFILNDRLTHRNLEVNPHACYLFREEGKGYKGKRFFLTKLREEKDSTLLIQLRRRNYLKEQYHGPKFLVFFAIDEELPLIGAGEEEEQEAPHDRTDPSGNQQLPAGQ